MVVDIPNLVAATPIHWTQQAPQECYNNSKVKVSVKIRGHRVKNTCICKPISYR